ncbi:hypothetical protein G7077_08975 [Sphingomonas piscis]|uniref:SGNH/GDSL hydrolase family protein n=1 Tax=Sphingomonas piscis TaxID=2714943 RepID=A0A6G7YQK0_9SPHN|nr:hypothetical protein [Sphingomonas piscis]QIK79007.1 hypothetical protein G7077_08975 [Sphingomonas piscis]
MAGRTLLGQPAPVTVLRQYKEKKGVAIGDLSFEHLLRRIAKLGPDDIVLSMIGGSQYAVFSTVQHPQPFDFYVTNGSIEPDPEAQIIPFRTLEEFFATTVLDGASLDDGGKIRGDRQRLEAVKSGTQAQVIHLLPPPPAYDNENIARRHENLFADGIRDFGVAPPELRLKFWSLQADILTRFCANHGIELMPPPGKATSNGYLRPEYHHGGAHANQAYGELLLQAVEARLRTDDSKIG